MQIAIIGNGKMGKWFSNYFRQKGFLVSVYGKEDGLEEIYQTDYIMIAVSLDKTEKVIEKLTNYVHKDQLVFDIASIKSHFIEKMKKMKCKIGSIHPMFGPNTEKISEKNVIIISDLGKEQELLKKIFKEATLIEMDYKKHDFMMAYTQVLPYIMNIAFKDMIKNKKIVSAPIFNMQKQVCKKVLEDIEIAEQIIKLNPYSKSVIEKYKRSLKL